MDNVGDQPVMMSSRFQQAKPSATASGASVTVTSDVAGNDRQFSQCFTTNEGVGTSRQPNHDSSRCIVSWPLRYCPSQDNTGCIYRISPRFRDTISVRPRRRTGRICTVCDLARQHFGSRSFPHVFSANPFYFGELDPPTGG
jgi:hypothetical protein